jgi:hypothetical protein
MFHPVRQKETVPARIVISIGYVEKSGTRGGVRELGREGKELFKNINILAQ